MREQMQQEWVIGDAESDLMGDERPDSEGRDLLEEGFRLQFSSLAEVI